MKEKEFELSEEKAIEIGKFLKKRREEMGYSTNQMLLKTGISKGDLSRIENGKKKKINPIYLKELCRVLKLNVIDVFKMVDFLDDKVLQETKLFKGKKQEEIADMSKYVTLNVYGKASAGNGFLNLDYEISSMIVRKGNFSNKSFLVEIHGNNMSPTLEEGQLAVVDPEKIDYIKGKIYVVTYNGESYIKRIEVSEKLKLVILKSDNPKYDDIYINEEEQEHLIVNGRVVELITYTRL